jgi:hypothetical protein
MLRSRYGEYRMVLGVKRGVSVRGGVCDRDYRVGVYVYSDRICDPVTDRVD